jgi:quercetin dioxygenase-like cupin family protein
MPRPRAYHYHPGALIRGTIYDYDAGDVLEIHTHNEPDNHCTIVSNGMLEVIGDNDHKGRIIAAGETVEWIAGQPHGFRALTPARMFNLLLNRNSDLTDGPI